MTKKPSIEETGVNTKTCFCCGHQVTSTIEKLTPTIKLSTKSKTLKKKHSFRLYVSNIAEGDAIESVKTSSKKILKVKRTKNTIVVTAKKTGKATVTVKLKSGKKASCKIKVVKDRFIFSVEGMNYSTRSNVFTASIKNYSKHTVIIYAAGEKCIDWDYKKFDRNIVSVNGKSTMKIKPGKTAKVRFKLSSSSIWPGYKRKTIKFKTKLDGQVKWIKISENDLY